MDAAWLFLPTFGLTFLFPLETKFLAFAVATHIKDGKGLETGIW